MPPLSVEVALSKELSISRRYEVASTVTSLYEVVVQPRIDGFLRSINYSDGMPVERGKLLFTIDDKSYNIARLAAQAQLEAARANEILARSNYERAVPLARIDAISQSDLDQYTATHTASKATTKSAEEALRNAELSLSYTKIYAPISGLVASSPATVGDYVGIGTAISTLTTISYIDTVEVAFPIPTSIYMQSLTTSAEGSFDNSELLSNIELTLSGGQKYEWAGEYGYTQKDSPASSSTVVVVVKFPNPKLQLKSGMFARVSSDIGAPQQRVVVPQIAVSQMQGVNSVWVVGADSVVNLRFVKLGQPTDKGWVVEEGLAAGEMVLCSGQLKVHNGARVVPQKI